MDLSLAIAGNVGVGKSTLTKLLTDAFGAKPFFEPSAENPYLADFYQDMSRWAFHSQMYFLSTRLKHHAAMMSEKGILIQDRSLYENAEIFARYLYEKGHIIDRDWNIYEEIYRTAVELLKPPHLIIYLQASVPSLIERIKTRGRSFEQDMDEAYLQDLNRLYESWAMHFTRAPILTIHTDQIRYLDDPAEWQHVLGMINDRIGGTQLSARL